MQPHTRCDVLPQGGEEGGLTDKNLDAFFLIRTKALSFLVLCDLPPLFYQNILDLPMTPPPQGNCPEGTFFLNQEPGVPAEQNGQSKWVEGPEMLGWMNNHRTSFNPETLQMLIPPQHLLIT